MKPLLFPEDYRSEDIFKNEWQVLEDSCWFFAGLKSDLDQHQDFVVVPISKQSIVVQNFNGNIRAFQNVCTHRFSKIQTTKRGNRPLLCPYHGWNFDENGKPIGIPKKPHFGDIDACTLKELHLTKWQVDSVGSFVFVAKDSVGTTLKEYLGDYAGYLEKVSAGIGDEIDCNELDLECNWKIAVENTLESYHVMLVHPESFYKLGPSGETFTFSNFHSDWITTLNDKTMSSMEKLLPLYESRPFRVGGYKHLFIFPNLTLATTMGTSFSIQRFDGKSAGKTQFTSWVYGTVLSGLKKSKEMMIRAMNKSIVDFNRQVFHEDKVICREVQEGVQISESEGILSDIEGRVHAFQKSYKEVVSR